MGDTIRTTISPETKGASMSRIITSYESRVPYERERIHAAAIYCSDGRVGEHFDDFLQNGLGLPRYDRVALPGGPACLAGHTEAHVQESGVVEELRFLVDAHELERVVLIAHQGCAFYLARLGLPEKHLLAQQTIDLLKATAFIRRITGIQHVESYLLRHDESQVRFERVDID